MNKLFPLVITILFSLNSYSQLSGSYTIGGASPNYSTLDSALLDLHSKGVSGPVSLNFRPGKYIGRYKIGKISGTSKANTIVFQPDNGYTDKVILTDTNGGPYELHLINLDTTGFLKFKKLHFIPKQGSPYLFHFSGFVHDVEIDSCFWYLPTALDDQENFKHYGYGIYKNSSLADSSQNITISNNVIHGGTNVIACSAVNVSKGIKNRNWKFIGNDFREATQSLFWLSYGFDSLIIENNYIESSKVKSGGNFISITGSDHIQIRSNHIINWANYAYGFVFDEVDADTSAPNYFTNNTISFPNVDFGSTTSGSQIYFFRSSHFSISNNSIYEEDGYSSLIRISGTCSNFEVKNNAVFNNGKGYAINSSSNSVNESNNCFYAPKGIHSNKTLSSTSFSKDPLFSSLKMLTSHSNVLNDKGTKLAYNSKDINGISRSLTKPDIGAYEYKLYKNDASLAAIEPLTGCSGNQNIRVRLGNTGWDTLKSVSINWRVKTNSSTPVLQTPFSFSSSLLNSDDTILALGTVSLSAGNSYELEIWTSSPNLALDSNNANDTLHYFLDSVRTFNGTYTIGGSSPDFNTVSQAIDALNKYGVCGPVIFNIRQGTFNEHLQIERIRGVNGQRRITFQSDPANSGPVRFITPNPSLDSNYYFKLNSAQYISFKGLDFESPKTINYRRSIWISGAANNLSIDSCRFFIPGNPRVATGSGPSLNSYIFKEPSLSSSTDSISITNNLFRNNAYGVTLLGSKRQPLFRNSNWTISNNRFDEQLMGAIMARHYFDSLVVSGNSISESQYGGKVAGIGVLNSRKVEIVNNYIENQVRTFPICIEVIGDDSTNAKASLIANNIICMNRKHNSYSYAVGIRLKNMNNCRVVNNSISNSKDKANAIEIDGCKSLVLKNNSVGVFGSGYGVKFLNAIVGLSESNNNFYVSGGSKSNRNSILSSSTISKDPMYYSKIDLHSFGSDNDSAGTPLNYISKDFDGEQRNATNPDIGADEFLIYNRNIELGHTGVLLDTICSGITPIRWKYRNIGLTKITSIIQKISIDSSGQMISTKLDTLIVSLDQGDTLVVSDSSYQFLKKTAYQIKVTSVKLNYLNDQDNSNDTVKFKINTRSTGTLAILNPDSVCASADSVKLDFIDSKSLYKYYGKFVNGEFFYPDSAGNGWHKVSAWGYDNFGCLMSVDTAIKVVSTVKATMDTLGPICYNLDTLLLSSGKPRGGTYYGSHITNNTFKISAVGSGTHIYSYSILGSNGCNDTASSVIIVQDSIVMNLRTDSSICTNDTLEIGINTLNFKYLWNTGDTISKIRVFAPGSYRLRVFDSVLCSEIDTFNLTLDSLPRFSLGNDTSICQNDTLLLNPNLAGVNHTWSTGSTMSSVMVSQASTTWLEVVDGNSCFSRDTIVVANFGVPTGFLGADTTICLNDTVTFISNSVFKKYLWSNGDTLIKSNFSSASVFWLQVTDSNSCMATDSLNLRNYSLPSISIGKDTSVCFGDSIALSTGLLYPKYQWSTGDTLSTIQVKTAGLYWLKVTDVKSCTNVDSIALLYHSSSLGNIGNDTSICTGDSAKLVYNLPYSSITWNSGATSNSIFVKKAGLYSITVIDSNKCLVLDSVEVSLNSLPKFNFGPDTSICSFDSLVLYPNVPGAKYQWLSGDTSAFVLVDSSGVYGLTVRDSNGCYFSDSINITIDSVPLVNLGPDTSFCGSNLFILRSSVNVKSYLWNTGDTIDTLALNKGGSYWLLVKDSNNCVGSDTVLVSYKAICVGIDESFLKNTTINYYPNPNSGTFNLNLNSDFNGEVKLIVRNMQGQIVSSESWLKTETDMIREINLNDQASGVYFLDLITPLGKAQHRITINK